MSDDDKGVRLMIAHTHRLFASVGVSCRLSFRNGTSESSPILGVNYASKPAWLKCTSPDRAQPSEILRNSTRATRPRARFRNR